MNNLAKQVFLIEIDHQCDYVIYASKGMQKALDNHEPKVFWFYAQALLVSSANISKLIWGNQETNNKRNELRRLLGVDNSSVLKSRYIRNAFEHFDEKLDAWVNDTDIFVDSNIGPKDIIAGIKPKNHLRFFDTEEISIKFKGDSFKVQAIIKAVYELKKLVAEQFNLIEVEQ